MCRLSSTLTGQHRRLVPGQARALALRSSDPAGVAEVVAADSPRNEAANPEVVGADAWRIRARGLEPSSPPLACRISTLWAAAADRQTNSAISSGLQPAGVGGVLSAIADARGSMSCCVARGTRSQRARWARAAPPEWPCRRRHDRVSDVGTSRRAAACQFPAQTRPRLQLQVGVTVRAASQRHVKTRNCDSRNLSNMSRIVLEGRARALDQCMIDSSGPSVGDLE